MNKRIKELVLQSQLVYETTDGKVYNSWEDYVDLTEYVEKFAELIVRECVDIACKHMELNEGTDYNIGEQIKQHFGVEE